MNLDVFKEVDGPDYPWRVLATCIMLQCSTVEKVRPVATEFFKRWPSAKSCRIGAVEEQVKVLAPLGMWSVKADRIRHLAKSWVIWSGSNRTPETFPVLKQPGCGTATFQAYTACMIK